MKLRNIFLPTEHNDYTPHALQKVAIVPLFLLVLLSFAASNLQSFFWKSSDWLVGAVLPAVIVDLTNEERQDVSQTPLRRNALLDKAATLKAEHMAKNQYFAHYSPDGVTPWSWFEQVSYQYAHAGENLAIHFSDSEDVVEAWMESPLHKDNIVNGNYTEIGVGTAKGTFDGYETVFVVQLFGTPAAVLQPQALLPVPTPQIVALVTTEEDFAPEPRVVLNNSSLNPKELASSNESGFVEGEADSATDSGIDLEEAEFDPKSLPAYYVPEETKMEPVTIELPVTATNYRSSYIATTSQLLPASLEGVSGTTASLAPLMGSLATKPNSLLQGLYLIIGLILASTLIVSIILGAKHHRPMQVAYGIGMMLIMSGLFYVHMLITSEVVIASAPATADFASIML